MAINNISKARIILKNPAVPALPDSEVWKYSSRNVAMQKDKQMYETYVRYVAASERIGQQYRVL
jgi:hypothetical protein